MRFGPFLFVTLLAQCGTSIFGQQDSGRPWAEMDYGPFLSMTIEADGPGRNIAYKGVMVTLDEATQTHVLFDEDLLRVAAAWTGGKLDWRSVVYDGSHGTHPSIVGQQLFGNGIGPGWSISGDFSDPRKLPYGPLPRGQAHYKGLYLHDGRVVFEYTVGGTRVREMPGIEKVGDQLIVTRTIEIPQTLNNMTLQVAQSPDAGATLVTEGNQQIAVLGDLSAARPQPKLHRVPDTGLLARWTFDADSNNIPEGVRLVPGRGGRVLQTDGKAAIPAPLDRPPRLAGRAFSIAAWVRTKSGGTVVALAPEGKWVPGGRSLFIRGGRLVFDIGWVGAVTGRTPIADGEWHHVALTSNRDGKVRLFVDGRPDGRGQLEPREDALAARLFFGRTSDNFPGGDANGLRGELDDVCLYDRVLTDTELAAMTPAPPPPGITAATTTGLSDWATWRIDDGSNLRLHIPAQATPARFKVLLWNGPAADLKTFRAAAATSPRPEPLEPRTHGGPARFSQTVTTRGKLGTSDTAWAIDELTLPTDNPWKSWMRLGGFDWFSDPTQAAVCTWNGDVWIVSGINDTLSQLTWKRIATGMFQPLGVRVIDDTIYVCCRDQITVLRDLNGDGEADFYQNFNNDHQVTEHFHEFAMDLQTDAKGNFYYAKSARHALDSVVPHHGTLIRVSPDGRTSEIVCNGFRAANGVGIGPHGELSTSDQEGHWTPANRINLVRDGGFYGNMYSYHRGERPTSYEPPVVWLPKNVDRSPAESLWVTSDKWGPLRGSLISTSYGTGQLFLVPYEKLGTVHQGGAVRMPLDFPTGTMRGRFHPRDGQLYVCGLFGWSSNKTQPGGFYRVRYTGQPVHLPIEYHVASNGIRLKFTEPLDAATAGDASNYAIRQWNYRWTKNYGSAHWKVSDPNQEGADTVPVQSATLLPDQRTVFLEIEDLQPVMQMQISWALRDVDGRAFEDDLYATINRLGPRFDLDTAGDMPRKIVRRTQLEPGLVQQFPAGTDEGHTADARVVRLAAFRNSDGPPSPFAAPDQTMTTFVGKLQIDRPGQYRFRVQGGGRGVVAINGRPVAQAAAIRLSAGDHDFSLTARVPANQAVRAEWGSEAFDWEPIPPRALAHDPRDGSLALHAGRREGRTLFAEHGCVRCHSVPQLAGVERSMPELTQLPPSLVDAGTRFRPDWLASWILRPKQLRPDTRMPALLHGSDVDANEADAADIAAWLSTLGSSDPPPAPGDATAGAQLFEQLGCLACHRTSEVDAADELDRLSLHHVNQKYRPGALVAFLRKPHEHAPARGMPDFALSDVESRDLAAWLRSVAAPAPESVRGGNPRQGRILFGSVGCSNCHAVDQRPPGGESLSLTPRDAGCLANDPAQRGEAPDFGFSEHQRRLLLRFLERDLPSLARVVPSEAAERAIRRLNCTACHTRDASPGRFREVFAEESDSGTLPERIPPLTWAGEKFRSDWLAAFVSGRNTTRLRPHLKIRMPRFGSSGDVIASGLAQQHGIQPQAVDAADAPPTADLVQLGRKLVGRDGGFNCTQCHGLGDVEPTAAFDAIGVNLDQITTRIRRPFYDRWMRDPTRVDPATRMLKLATDGRTSVRDVLDGNADAQFRAIWAYLKSLE